jgi:hypothetical protein
MVRLGLAESPIDVIVGDDNYDWPLNNRSN